MPVAFKLDFLGQDSQPGLSLWLPHSGSRLSAWPPLWEGVLGNPVILASDSEVGGLQMEVAADSCPRTCDLQQLGRWFLAAAGAW